MENVLLRCKSCGTINRVAIDKFGLDPKCASCKNLLTWPDWAVSANDQSFESEVLKDPGIVMIDFWNETCGYCKMMDPTLDQIAHEKAGIIKIVRMNTADSQKQSSVHRIQGVPSFALYNSGRFVKQTAGAMPKDQLLSWIFSK